MCLILLVGGRPHVGLRPRDVSIGGRWRSALQESVPGKIPYVLPGGTLRATKEIPLGGVLIGMWKPILIVSPMLSGILCAGPIEFEDVTESAGLLKPLEGMMGHGAALGDVDGDGLVDLYVGGFADRPDEEYAPAASPPRNVLLKNKGGLSFSPWDQEPVQIHARTSGAVFVDLDNDGDVDLYVANNAKAKSSRDTEPQRSAAVRRSSLFRNDGGKLIDVSKDSGACPDTLRTARNICPLDYDGDGLLDLLVLEDRFVKNPSSRLFRNLGGMKFQDVTGKSGLPADLFGLGLAVADLNGDRRPDFFVGHSNRLFLSAEGDRYVESEELNKTFAWQPLDGEDWPCGVAFGDLNRDGRLDMVLSIHHVKARNRIYLNEGIVDGFPRFRDVTKDAGLPDFVSEKSPHVEIQDFDNDGWPDLYFSTAWMSADGSVAPLVYRHQGLNGGVPMFQPENPKAGSQPVYYPAGPSGDLDGDGLIDLFLVNWFRGNHSRLLKNTSGGGHRWLAIEVEGKSINKQGIGTRIRISSGGKLLGSQELGTGHGYASGQHVRSHFGLGNAEKVDVELTFQDGTKRIIEGVEKLNRVMKINQ